MKKIEELRRKLKLAREENGHTCKEVSEQTNIARSTVGNFEGGYGWYSEGRVGKKTIVNICDYLDEDPGNYLYLGKHNNHSFTKQQPETMEEQEPEWSDKKDFEQLHDQLDNALSGILELQEALNEELSEEQMDNFGGHLDEACSEAYEELIQGFDSMLNGAWHKSGDIGQKMKLLSELDFGR